MNRRKKILFAMACALAVFGASADDATPRRGGTLRVPLDADISSLDPSRTFDVVTSPFLLLLYQGLVEYGDGLDVEPCLAKDWKLSDDRKTYTFTLRPDIKFSNGRGVRASDIIYTLERILSTKTSAPTESYFEGIVGAKEFRAGKAEHVSGLRTIGNDVVEIELRQPDPTFIYVLTLPGAMIVPREAVEDTARPFGTHPVGTGPYILTQWRRGVRMRFERNPLFAHPEHQYLDAVDAVIGGDSTLHLMMFESGELDIADISDTGIPVPDFARIEHSPRWRGLIERMPEADTWFFGMNTEMEPFNNRLVRQAVSHAVNKQKIAGLFHNMVQPATGILPPSIPGFNSNLTAYPYDPAKARQLLAQAGYPNGFSCKLWCKVGLGFGLTAASAIQFDLAQVGIKAELNPMALAPLLDSMDRRKTVQCCVIDWSQDYPDPSDFLDIMFNGNHITDEGCQNFTFYNNPAVNKLLGEAAVCKDAQQRLGMYQAAEKMTMEDAPCVCLFYPYSYALHQPWVHGLKLHPVWYYRFERMWIAK